MLPAVLDLAGLFILKMNVNENFCVIIIHIVAQIIIHWIVCYYVSSLLSFTLLNINRGLYGA